MSHAVFVATHKYDGEFIHPIWSDVGMTSRTGAPTTSGNTYTTFHYSPDWHTRSQKTSLISSLLKKIGRFFFFVSEIARMMWGRTDPSCESETDGISNPATCRRNDRSKMARKSRDLWGIIDIGDNFKFLDGSYFMSSHSTIVVNPPATLFYVSWCECSIASGDKPDW